jgi:hypothetical protein
MCGPQDAVCTDRLVDVTPDGTTTLTLDAGSTPSLRPAPAGTFEPREVRATDPNVRHRDGDERRTVTVTELGCIRIYGSAEFRAAVESDLRRLRATAIGRGMLDCYWNIHQLRTHAIRIYPCTRCDEPDRFTNAYTFAADTTSGGEGPDVSARACHASSPYAEENGTGAHIYYNPTLRSEYLGRELFSSATRRVPKDPWLVLAHEIVHALHDAHGKNLQLTMRQAADDTSFPNIRGVGGAEEEFTIVGEYLRLGTPLLDPDSIWTQSLTENALLGDPAVNLPLRVDHATRPTCIFRDGTGQWYRSAGGEDPAPIDPPPGELGSRVPC